ncbi:MAG TPA: glycoside hydrolase family 130 protein [Ruminiclostridium sp.]
MIRKRGPLIRYGGNPILTPETMPFECFSVFNTGAVRFKGKYLLLLRVEHRDLACYFYTAISDDGINFTVNQEPINYPCSEAEKNNPGTRFDMRITPIDGTFYVCHAIYSSLGSQIAMARTDDFVNFEPISNPSVPSNRNAVLFPEKIGGLYARLERPQDLGGTGAIWISYSPDLIFWGKSSPLFIPRMNWGTRKVGAGIIPIKTEKGWLEIYHGTMLTASTENYFLGAVLLDLEDPSKVIAAPKEFILAPEMDYERIGQVPNVVFTGGAIETDDGKLNIYYGGADTRVCLAQTTVSELLEFCLNSK